MAINKNNIIKHTNKINIVYQTLEQGTAGFYEVRHIIGLLQLCKIFMIEQIHYQTLYNMLDRFNKSDSNNVGFKDDNELVEFLNLMLQYKLRIKTLYNIK